MVLFDSLLENPKLVELLLVDLVHLVLDKLESGGRLLQDVVLLI